MFDFSQSCSDSSSALWGLFDFSIAPNLLFYAYIPIIIISLFFGIFVMVKDKYSARGKLLFYIALVFSALLLNEILQWIAAPVSLVELGWQMVPLFRILVAVLTIIFVYAFVKKRALAFYQKLILSASFIAVLVLLPTNQNVTVFDLNNCEGVPGPLWTFVHLFEAISVVWVLGITIFDYLKTGKSISERYQNAILGGSATLFLIVFFTASVWGDVTRIYDVALIGPLGMLIFISVLSYMIVRFKIFNIKLLSAQVLVFALIMLIGSQLFFIKSKVNFVLTCFTLMLASIGGYFLVRSVVKEVKQREEIEKLAENLRLVNERLRALDKMKSEFVSIASHQLRSPLTSIRGYASMLAEGSYGKLSAKVQEITERIAESGKYMALSIEDYLNVSRIEAGNMKYEKSDFNLKEMAEKIVDEMRPVALKKGLVMVFRSDCNGSCGVHADIGKTRQAIMNILDNSMKYTPKGTITVVAHDDLKKKTVRVTIQDTGVGMNKEALEELFNKFVRAKNANQVNVSGSGLGLYIARKMVTDMGGNIWAESEGEGKGSTFIIEFPLLPGKPGK